MDYSVNLSGNVISIVPSGTLTYNTQYTVTLYPGLTGQVPGTNEIVTLGSTYTFWFTSQYCPLFTSLTRVKLEAGPQAELLTDDTIYRMINKNSIDAMDLWNMTEMQYHPPWTFGCDWTQVPYILRRYVECKTAYDILSLLQLMNDANSGMNQMKKLGDMTIHDAPAAINKLDPSKRAELYACWNTMLRSIQMPHHAIKGIRDQSKGFPHPVKDINHNRLQRTVSYSRWTRPVGPWEHSRGWRATIGPT